MDPRPFPTPAALRAWFAKNHAKETELWILFYKVSSPKRSVRYPEALDEALCVGWIDGIVKRVDDESHVQRWTPRKKRSYWSTVNIKKAEALIAAGRMKPAGLAAFEARDKSAAARYSFENDTRELPAGALAELKMDNAALAFWEEQPPSYRKAATWWIVSAKREETKARRIATLLKHTRAGERLPHLVSPGTSNKPARKKAR